MKYFTILKLYLVTFSTLTLAALCAAIYWHQMEYLLISIAIGVFSVITGAGIDLINDKQKAERRANAKTALPSVIENIRANGEFEKKVGK